MLDGFLVVKDLVTKGSLCLYCLCTESLGVVCLQTFCCCRKLFFKIKNKLLMLVREKIAFKKSKIVFSKFRRSIRH